MRPRAHTRYHLIPPKYKCLVNICPKETDLILFVIVIEECTEWNFVYENMNQRIFALTDLQHYNITLQVWQGTALVNLFTLLDMH